MLFDGARRHEKLLERMAMPSVIVGRDFAGGRRAMRIGDDVVYFRLINRKVRCRQINQRWRYFISPHGRARLRNMLCRRWR